MKRWLCLLAGIAVVAGFGCRDRTRTPATAGPPVHPSTLGAKPAASVEQLPDDPRLLSVLDELALIARGTELTSAERAELRGADLARARAFVQRMATTDPGVARQANVVLFAWATTYEKNELEVMNTLSSKQTSQGRELYYAGDTACDEKSAVEVTPWWDMSKKVLVCSDAYRPDALIAKGLPIVTICAPGFPGCGCGPYLMMCSPNSAARDQLRRSFMSEFSETVVYLISKRRPLRDLFVEKSTFRDRRAELWQRRTRVINGERADDVFRDFAQWPEHGKWAPRAEVVPDQEAGLLTTPHMFWFDTGPRVQMQIMHESMWCSANRSINVSVPQLFDIKTPDFRFVHKEGLQLAVKPVCETCHARLDHSMVFFEPLTPYLFMKPKKAARAKLYIDDSRDLRGEDNALPGGFARLATAAPEFGQCMAKRVVDHVMGQNASADDYRAVHAAFESKGDYGSLVSVALERLLERRTRAPAAPPPPAPLAALLDEHCSSCHFAGSDNGVDLSPAALKPAVLLKALEEVASERMPKGFPPVGAETRAQIIDVLIAAWPVADERPGLVRAYAQSHSRPQVMRPETVQHAVHARAGAKGANASEVPTPYANFTRRQMALTPDLAVFGATQAIKACKQRGNRDLKTCATEASSGLLFETGGR